MTVSLINKCLSTVWYDILEANPYRKTKHENVYWKALSSFTTQLLHSQNTVKQFSVFPLQRVTYTNCSHASYTNSMMTFFCKSSKYRRTAFKMVKTFNDISVLSKQHFTVLFLNWKQMFQHHLFTTKPTRNPLTSWTWASMMRHLQLIGLRKNLLMIIIATRLC